MGGWYTRPTSFVGRSAAAGALTSLQTEAAWLAQLLRSCESFLHHLSTPDDPTFEHNGAPAAGHSDRSHESDCSEHTATVVFNGTNPCPGPEALSKHSCTWAGVEGGELRSYVSVMSQRASPMPATGHQRSATNITGWQRPSFSTNLNLATLGRTDLRSGAVPGLFY